MVNETLHKEFIHKSTYVPTALCEGVNGCMVSLKGRGVVGSREKRVYKISLFRVTFEGGRVCKSRQGRFHGVRCFTKS